MKETEHDTFGQSEIATLQDEGKCFLISDNIVTHGILRTREHLNEIVCKPEEGMSRVTSGELTLTADTEAQLSALSPTIIQVYIFLLKELYERGYPAGFRVTEKEYRIARGGMKDRKTAKKLLWDGVNVLSKITVSFDWNKYQERTKRKRLTQSEESLKNYKNFNLLLGNYAEKQKSKYIPIRFDPCFSNYLKNTVPSPYPNTLLTVDPYRNPLVICLGFLIFSHKDTTSRFREDGQKEDAQIRENVLSVKSLLNAANLPCYADAKGNILRNYRRDVITPIEKALSFFSDDFTWVYCRGKGASLENSFTILPQNFDTLYIYFKFKNHIKTRRRSLLNAPERKESCFT